MATFPKTPSRAASRAAIALAALLLAAGPASANMDRAREAMARGDLRAAQLELRNAIRQNPQAVEPRITLARLSLELGDADTAEREARAAMERGFDRVQGTQIVLRAHLALGRTREILRDFPMPSDPAQAPLGARIAAARALAHLQLDDRPAARAAAEDAVRLGPDVAEAHLAQSAVAVAFGDREAAERAADRALQLDPNSVEATMRKATLVYQRGQPAEAADLLQPLIARQPTLTPARVLRADALLRLGRDADARVEVDAVLRAQPGNASANYLHALLLGRAGDWRAADETFQRIGAALANFPEGFLMAATARRQVGQAAQAEDLAQRHVARNPEDPRGARLLAILQMEASRADQAAGVLQRLADRGAADADSYDLLGRAYTAARRPREAVAAFEKAVELAPNNLEMHTRLAAARLALGDVAGAAVASGAAERLGPTSARMREVNAAAALGRGDLAAAQSELDRLEPEQRRTEVAMVLAASIRLGHFDLPAARAGFEAALTAHPDSIGARLGLARVLAATDDLPAAERLWGEVLRRDPTHPEALGRLASLARPGGPRTASARAILEAAQSGTTTTIAPAMALANALASGGDLAGAARVMEGEAFRSIGRGAAPALMRSQVYAALQRWTDAEDDARTAVAEEPESAGARRQLALLMLRDGRAQQAEALLQEGLRRRPNELLLQQTLVGVVNQARGPDAAFAVADQLARQSTADSPARGLRGDFLMVLQRPADAAAAYAAANAEAPSSYLAIRAANAWRAANEPARAVPILEAMLQREPENLEVLDLLSNIEIQLGRNADAERRLAVVVERAPGHAPALNNLAWLMAVRGDAQALPRARTLAERAHYLLPSAQTADTLGWVLALSGESARALPLLRDAAASTGASQRPDRGIIYRYAYALNGAGQRAEALAVLEPALATPGAFPERAAAERLLAELRARR